MKFPEETKKNEDSRATSLYTTTARRKRIPNVGELTDRENGGRDRKQEEIQEFEEEADQGYKDEKDPQLSLEAGGAYQQCCSWGIDVA